MGGGICRDGEGRGREISVMCDGEDANGSVEAEFDGDEKVDDRILVGYANRRVDRLRGVGLGSTGNENGEQTSRTDHSTDWLDMGIK